jgi:hypothetical protein
MKVITLYEHDQIEMDIAYMTQLDADVTAIKEIPAEDLAELLIDDEGRKVTAYSIMRRVTRDLLDKLHEVEAHIHAHSFVDAILRGQEL